MPSACLLAVLSVASRRRFPGPAPARLGLAFAGLLGGLACSGSGSSLQITSVEPPRIAEGRGRQYTIHGRGFTEDTRVYLDVRSYVGSRPSGEPDHRANTVSADGTTLGVFIRPYGHLTQETLFLSVLDGGREASLEVAVESHHAEIRALVDRLTLEELVGQTLMVGFDALEDAVLISNRRLVELVGEFGVGGAIIFKHNLPRPQDFPDPLAIPEWAARLTNDLQDAVARSQDADKRIPLIIAIDQEGGSGNILKGPGVTQLPDPASIGVTREARLARAAGRAVGRELRYLGINATLAPIADISTTEYERIRGLSHNPTIGVRSFGAHKDIVTPLATEFMKGLQDGGVLSVAKHFPGHGTSLLNPHKVMPTIEYRTSTELENWDLVPFKALIAQGVNGLLTSHILVPPWDASTPVTFSEKIIGEHLREGMGFDGLVITDDMSTMEGILRSGPSRTYPTGSKIYTRREAILRAHRAGHDITILGHVYPDAKLQEQKYRHLLEAEALTRTRLMEIFEDLKTHYDGREEELQERVARILYQKAALFGCENFDDSRLWGVDFAKSEYEEILEEGRQAAEEILRNSAVLLSKRGEVRGDEGKFQFFRRGEGPLSPSRLLVEAGDPIALASPVYFTEPDELLAAVKEAGRGSLGEISRVKMVYGFYRQPERDRARQHHRDPSIEILTRVDARGNFIFDDEQISAAIDGKVDEILEAARGKKILLMPVVTRPQIEILERLQRRMDALPGTMLVALLFKEPYLVSPEVYESDQTIVLQMSAFPDFQTAVDVLFGRVVPKPTQYSSLNAHRMPIRVTGGASVVPLALKETHTPSSPGVTVPPPPPPWLVVVKYALAGLAGALVFFFLLMLSVAGRHHAVRALGASILMGVGIGVVTRPAARSLGGSP